MSILDRCIRTGCLTIVTSVLIWFSVLPWITKSIWRDLPTVHAQAFTTIPLTSLNAPGCTQLLAGTGTQAIRIENGLLSIAAGGTGQTVTIGFTSSNTNATGVTPTCSTTFGNPVNAALGSTGLFAKINVTTASIITFPPSGSPALVTPVSSALIIVLDNTNAVGGGLTVLQQ
jgi:hypothetical protein